MTGADLHVVTGAFSYTGKYIARRLLSQGKRVRTLTGHPRREDPFKGAVEVCPLDFNRPSELVENLRGATTLYNTYWIRFPSGAATFERAVENSKTLIRAAKEASIRRLVHVSITNASEASPLPYFKGKGLVEKAVRQSGISYAILRPTVVFGAEDILINNIAWLLRRSPFFPVAGSGNYKLQPVYVDDLAQLAVRAGEEATNTVVDAVGPETYAFVDLVKLMRRTMGVRSRTIHVPPWVLLSLSKGMGYLVKDVVLTRDELRGLMASLLVSESEPTSQTRLSEWVEQNRSTLGQQYASELRRHYR